MSMPEPDYLFKKLPLICEEILKENYDKDLLTDREVTHMLILASAGITMPLERLDKGNSSNNYSAYKDELDKMAKVKNSDFSESPFYEAGVWFYDEWLGDADQYRNLLNKPKAIESSISADGFLYKRNPRKPYSVEQFLKHLRHALAHGNIYFQGQENIERLIFLKDNWIKKSEDNWVKNSDIQARYEGVLYGLSSGDANLIRSIVSGSKGAEGYAYLMTSPQAFKGFLDKWFDFVRDLNYPIIYASAAD